MKGIAILLPLGLVVALGALLRRRGLLPREVVPCLTGLLYWVALPALLLRTAASAGAEALGHPAFFLGVTLPFLAVPLLAWGIARWAHRGNRPRQAFSAFASIRANNVYLGLPAVTLAMGEPGVRALSAYLAAGLVGYNVASLAWAELVRTGRLDLPTLGRALGRLARNPLILSTLGGLACAAAGLERFPAPLDLPLKILGDTASGLALLSLGASLEFRALGRAVRSTLPDSLVKLLLHPALAWLCLLPFGLPRELVSASVLVSAMPHAVNCFIVAQEMDLDAPYAADAVLGSTLLSALSFPLWLAVLGLG